VAVTSIDSKVDAVGACVGVRGTRIKNIVDELGGERIDIVRWNESLQVLIPNALQPAEIDEVMLCQLLGRAIVLVGEDQLSLAIGRRGQNVRLASKLVGWDIEIMTSEELDELIEKAVAAFTKIDGVDTDLAEKLVEQGILSFDDLSVMEIADLVNTIEGLTEEQTVEIVARAEKLAEEQVDDLPRRKGARTPAAPPAEPVAEGAAVEAADARAGRGARPTLDDLFGNAEGSDSDGAPTAADLFAPESDPDPDSTGDDSDAGGGDADPDAAEEDPQDAESDEDIRDLALAAEGSDFEESGHEVTTAPSDADQSETVRIVTEAVTTGSPSREPSVDADEDAGHEPDTLRSPPTGPGAADPAVERDSEMHQP